MKINIYYYIAVLLVLTVLIPFTLVHADPELENENLVRMVNVLNSLTPLINEAQRQQDKTARVQFQYDLLQADINKIKSGITAKLQSTTIEPRNVIPLQGDYLTQKRK